MTQARMGRQQRIVVAHLFRKTILLVLLKSSRDPKLVKMLHEYAVCPVDHGINYPLASFIALSWDNTLDRSMYGTCTPLKDMYHGSQNLDELQKELAVTRELAIPRYDVFAAYDEQEGIQSRVQLVLFLGALFSTEDQ